MEFKELPPFTREIDELLSVDEFRLFQNELIADPLKGDVLKGTGGARKIRAKFGLKGKSGGARAIYYFVGHKEKIWFLAVYPKSKKEALSKFETQMIKAVVDQIKKHEQEN
jgi:hypothetical protein